MTIKIKYAPGTRVKFHSPDYAKDMTGTVIEVNIMVNSNEIVPSYTVDADEVIKSSSIHTLDEKFILKKIK